MTTTQGSYTCFIDTATDDDLTGWQPVCFDQLVGDALDEHLTDNSSRETNARALVNSWAVDNGEERGLYRIRVVGDETGETWTSGWICVRNDSDVDNVANEGFKAGPDGISLSRSESGDITLTIERSAIMLADAVDEDGHPWLGFRWQSTVRGEMFDVGYAPTVEAMRAVLNSWLEGAVGP